MGGEFENPEFCSRAYSDITNKTGDKDYTAWTADVFFEYPLGATGTITPSGAHLNISFDDAYKGNNPDPNSVGIDGEKNGWYVQGRLFDHQ